MKITKKETRVSVRITPYQETQLDVISEKLGIKRSTLVRYAIDNLISSYNDLQLEQI
jgi:predicted DNA-binding protein